MRLSKPVLVTLVALPVLAACQSSSNLPPTARNSSTPMHVNSSHPFPPAAPAGFIPGYITTWTSLFTDRRGTPLRRDRLWHGEPFVIKCWTVGLGKYKGIHLYKGTVPIYK